jgi:hypothetical protein
MSGRRSMGVRGSVEWDTYEGEGAEVKCDCMLQVVALKGFAGPPTKDSLPPYTRLVNAVSKGQLGDLLNTKLMIRATHFKWETFVRTRVVDRLRWYLVHFALASTALIISTQTSEDNIEFHANGGWMAWDMTAPTPAMMSDVLHAFLLISNSLVVAREIKQYVALVSSIREHLSDMWNLFDLGGILALYVASGAHFAHQTYLLQQVGAFGVLLNAFSVLQMLQPFDLTGPLIATVIEIIFEIRGFVCILMILLVGFSVSFTVSMPENDAFDSGGAAGPLAGVMTTFQAIVGSFHMKDYSNSEAKAFFYLFLFAMVVVMLNLLIAIMGDAYEKVKEREVVEARKLQAQVIIDEEAMMHADGKCDNAKLFPEFLEVLQGLEPPPPEWAGVSGAVSLVEAQVAALRAETTEKVERVEAQVKEGQEKMAAEMVELKTMIAQLLVQQQQAQGGD